jgi:hypothetical protein
MVLFKAFKQASIVDSQGGAKQKWYILQEWGVLEK